MKRIFPLLALFAVPSAVYGGAPASDDPLLKDVLAKRLDGRFLEERADARAAVLDQEIRSWLADRVAFRKACDTASPPSELCALLREEDAGTDAFALATSLESEDEGLVPTPRAAEFSITGLLEKKDFGSLERVSWEVARKSLRKLDATAYANLSETWFARGGSSCLDPNLSFGLALKGEEFFPDGRMREWVTRHYADAERCADKGMRLAPERLESTRYRSSLLAVWASDCAKAVRGFEKLAENRESSYFSRALYWQARCALEAGDRLKHRVLVNRLKRLEPMSFHALLSNPRARRHPGGLIRSAEPHVRFRSASKPSLNPWLFSVERLLASNRAGDAGRVLVWIRDSFQAAEPGTQLYAAALAYRARDWLSQFRVLSNLFRLEPRQLTPRALSLFFPLERFDRIARHRGSADPLLVTALIRQESAFITNARSPVGALGLMQVMPQTARSFGRVSKRQLLDPAVNVRVGVLVLQNLVSRFDGNIDLAAAAYNAGATHVDRWVKRYPTEDPTLFLDLIPFPETRKYVAMIRRNYFWYTALYDHPPRVPASPQ